MTFVEGVTNFGGYRPNYRQLTLKVTGMVFVLHVSCVMDTVRQTRYYQISLTQDNREMYPETHSGKLK